ncbi:hypothetical protein STK_06005 [Sulfurisphaera tokodaii str. 7]|uniref:Uncharacterized protein n=1 Tax=Sulfurisphaera tokodaii (strain DSM 16993 / JCM 10545 / NBRC 100140 / 7) TaxID=273063 RepID=F9VN52_SULTO|nr:hypothetical protein STK_06005 [Sulfurisphaera tokodaii str. 7]
MRFTFVILSLIFMFIDESFSLYMLERIYGYEVFKLAITPWFLIPYSILIFLVEYILIRLIYFSITKFLHFLRRLVAFH